MSRGLDSTLVAALESKKFSYCFLVECESSGGTRYLTTYPRDLTVDGKLYSYAATLEVGNISENLNIENPDQEVTLSGLDSNVASLIYENEKFIGKKFTIKIVFINEATGAFLAQPYIVHEGPVKTGSLQEDKSTGSSTITVSVGGLLARFDAISGRRTNPTEWKQLYPGDEIFDQVPFLQEKRFELEF